MNIQLMHHKDDYKRDPFATGLSLISCSTAFEFQTLKVLFFLKQEKMRRIHFRKVLLCNTQCVCVCAGVGVCEGAGEGGWPACGAGCANEVGAAMPNGTPPKAGQAGRRRSIARVPESN